MRGRGASEGMASSFATGGTGGGLGRKMQVQKPSGAHQNKRREREGRALGHKGKGHHPGTAATGVFAFSPLNIANIQTLLQHFVLLQQVTDPFALSRSLGTRVRTVKRWT